MGGFVADEESELGGLDAFEAMDHAFGLKTEGATSQPLRFRHVANQDVLGFAGRDVLVAELVEKFSEFFGILIGHIAEMFVSIGGEAVAVII